ncbi:MAG: hypothetical protein P1V97_10265 [Planctomycetota bacterium]|nr:hypothetical protein [Planctomycetota bacterium]
MDRRSPQDGQNVGRDFTLECADGPKAMVSFESEWSLGGSSRRALPCQGRDLGRFLRKPQGWYYEPSAKAFANAKTTLFYRTVYFTDLEGVRTRFDLRNRNPFPSLRPGSLAFGGFRSAFLKIEIRACRRNLILYIEHSANRAVQGWHIALVDRRLTVGPDQYSESEISGFDDFLSFRRSGSGDARVSKLSEGEILNKGKALGHSPLQFGMVLNPGNINIKRVPWMDDD